MRGLVALVSIMSLMIVLCLGLVAYGFATKLGSDKLVEIPALTLPAGSKIDLMSEYKNSLALHVTGKEGKAAIWLVNPKTGKPTAHMPITEAAP